METQTETGELYLNKSFIISVFIYHFPTKFNNKTFGFLLNK